AYSIHQQPWPAYDEGLAHEETITVVLQVNGKVRDRVSVPANIDEEALKALALGSEAVKRQLQGKSPRQVVVVPRRLVNIVV
ncbi:MAG: hypothetical protein MUO23_09085, partial [Anaerolineales bacterium]|nr:hypothetical protein [Anaerolineales bacterium]